MWEKQKPDHRIRLSVENYSIPRMLAYHHNKRQLHIIGSTEPNPSVAQNQIDCNI